MDHEDSPHTLGQLQTGLHSMVFVKRGNYRDYTRFGDFGNFDKCLLCNRVAAWDMPLSLCEARSSGEKVQLGQGYARNSPGT